MPLRALDRLEEILTAALLAAMTLLTFGQVVLRYAFNSGIVWGLEATIYLFTWLVLIGISTGIRNDSHIAVELITDHLPAAAQRLAAWGAVALSLLYAVLMFLGSWTLIERLYAFGSLAHDIPLPRWALLSALPIGFGLLGLRLAQATVGIWRGTRGALGHQSQEAPSSLLDKENGE
jgi:C4-dicarboxylate transporter DctQ subunit